MSPEGQDFLKQTKLDLELQMAISMIKKQMVTMSKGLNKLTSKVELLDEWNTEKQLQNK